jgi:hypothetical protein
VRANRLGEFLRLGVVHVLAQVRADEHQAAGVADVGALRRADVFAEGQRETDVTRTAALREGRRGDVRRAERLERVLQDGAADAVREECDGLRAMPRLDRLQAVGHAVEGFVPCDLRPLLLATLLTPDERVSQAIRIEMRAHPAGATRTQAAAAQRVFGVPLDLPESAVLHGGDGAALPETDVAEGRDLADAPLRRFAPQRGARRPARSGAHGREAGRGAGDLQEPSSGHGRHGLDSVRDRHRRAGLNVWPLYVLGAPNAPPDRTA